MGLFSRPLNRADADRLTYHGSGPRRGILKHGAQAGRWRVEGERVGRQPGRNGDNRAPRRWF